MNKKFIITVGLICGLLTGCVPKQKTYEMRYEVKDSFVETMLTENIETETIYWENAEVETYN